MNILRSPSLHGRLSLVLTTLIAVMMMIGASVWLRETRLAIHEEVEAATRVAEQWLKVLVPETLADGPQARERLMEHLGAIGRIRANRLEVFAADGQRLFFDARLSANGRVACASCHRPAQGWTVRTPTATGANDSATRSTPRSSSWVSTDARP